MKVYVLWLVGTFPDDHEIVGAFPSKAEAEAWFVIRYGNASHEIEEYDVELPAEIEGEILDVDPYTFMTSNEVRLLVKVRLDSSSTLQGCTAAACKGRRFTMRLEEPFRAHGHSAAADIKLSGEE